MLDWEGWKCFCVDLLGLSLLLKEALSCVEILLLIFIL